MASHYFPFHNVDDDDFLELNFTTDDSTFNITSVHLISLHAMHDTCSDITFQTHEYDEDVDDRPSDVMHNIDPDNHFYNNIPTY